MIKNDLSKILKDPWRYAVDHVRIHYRGTHIHQRLPVTSQKARELSTSKKSALHITPGTLLHHMFTKSSALPELLKLEHMRHLNMIKSTETYTSAVSGVLENTAGPMSEQRDDDMIDGGYDISPHQNALDASHNSVKQSKHRRGAGNNGKANGKNKKTDGLNQQLTQRSQLDQQLAKITDTPVQQTTSGGRVLACMSEGAAEAAYDDLCYFKRLDKFECELQDCLTTFVKEYEAALATLKENNTTTIIPSLVTSTQRPQRKRKTPLDSSKPKQQKHRKKESTYYDYIGNVSNTSTSASNSCIDDDDYLDDDETSFGTISPLPSSCTDDDDEEEPDQTNKNW